MAENRRKAFTRKLWTWLHRMPDPIRAWLIRREFSVEYGLPPDIVFKQAETNDEVTQALKLVHDSYVDLGYMQANEEQLRLNKFMMLPSTVILIIKSNEEVIGTMSIIMRSALGLPSETSWDLKSIIESGRTVAEISSLCIVKNQMRRGRLFLPLCKLMYEYASQILMVDALVISTAFEVEPFYTDLLLFKRISQRGGEKNVSIQNQQNSSCCMLELTPQTVENYKKTYNHLKDSKNIYKFFVEYKLPNIQLPKYKESIHGYLYSKNRALKEILSGKEKEVVKREINQEELSVINNLNTTENTYDQGNFQHIKNRLNKRVIVRKKAWVYFQSGEESVPAKIIDVSRCGLLIQLEKKNTVVSLEQKNKIFVVMRTGQGYVSLHGEVVWSRDHAWIGCDISGYPSQDWYNYFERIWNEIEQEKTSKNFKEIKKKSA